jgi:hypothetical protein
MDIKFKSPSRFVVGVPQASIVFMHPNCFEVRSAANIQISFKSHNAKLE